MKDIFQFVKYLAYELENGNHLKRTNIQTVSFRSKPIKILEAKILDLSSGDKSIQISHYFQLKDKELTPERCRCHLSRIYIGQVGFMNSHLLFSKVPSRVKPLWHLSKQNIFIYLPIYIFYVYFKNS